VDAGHGTELLRLPDAGKIHKIFDGVFVGTPGANGWSSWQTIRLRAARRPGAGKRRR
jgi:hypothetical protein